MLSELRRGLPDVRALTGRAEAIPLIPAREREATRERIRAFVARGLRVHHASHAHKACTNP